MYEIGIDAGKRSSYIVVTENGNVLKEGYAETSNEGFDEYILGLDKPKIVFEASSSLDRIAGIVERYNGEIAIAHPRNVKMISSAVNKTDKNDAHTLLHLERMGYLPHAYLARKEIRNERNLCRSRDFLVRQRTAVKNRIHDQAYRLGIDFESFTKKNVATVRNASVPLKILADQLHSVNDMIKDIDAEIASVCKDDVNASFIDSIPGIGPYSALVIASEIGDINRFPTVENLWSYAGLVPKTHQSGTTEWKGHIIKGNVYLKYILTEVVQIHINRCPESLVAYAFERVRDRCGYKKAKIAAARHLLRIIYCMLKEQRDYRP